MSLVRSLLSRRSLVGAAFPTVAAAGKLARSAAAGLTQRGGRPFLFVCALVSCLLAMASPLRANPAMQAYVEAMQPGYNLGNTLDATPNETAWGNPLVTQAFIQRVAAQGFKSIRIPVTWDTGNRVGPAPTYTIDPAWLDRVQQIVDWSLDAGLYVMLNMHHDSGWVRTMPTNHDAVLAKFNGIWSQIAPRFRDHSNKLMFESINEPTFDGVDSATKNALLKELNVSFYHIVRSTGGGNATRPLVLPAVETNSGQEFLDSLSATITQLNDPNLIGTVHDYGFWPFSVNITGVTQFDGVAKDFTTAGIDRVYNTLVSQGIPVVVGEFGLLSFGGFGGAVEDGEALKFFEFLTSYYRSKGMTYQWWDAGSFLNRYTFQWNTPQLQDLYGYIMHSAVGRSSTAASDLIFVKDGQPLQDQVIQLNLNGNNFVSLTNGATTLTPGVDYTIAGDQLTLKSSWLAAYASGAYGVRTELAANFDAGMPWKFHVRHQASPVLGAVSGTKSGGIALPTVFNGDLLACMEAKYVAAPNYPYPGAASWTAFQGYNDAYLPDYANNRIVIKKEFFAASTNDAIEVTFHFWSGKQVSYRLTFQPGGDVGGTAQELVVYDDSFPYGWGNWSWASTNDASTEVVHSGSKSIAVDMNPWTGVMLGYWAGALNRSDYRTLTFWANGGPVGGQRLTVGAVVNWSGTGSTFTTDPIPANTWTKIEVPLDSLGVTDSSQITGLTFVNNTGGPLSRFYLDDVHLTTATASWIVYINGAPAPVITSASSAGGIFNGSFSYSTVAINGPVSFSAANLPPGLMIDPNTGVISGTPTAAGSYLVTITATNPAGTGSQTVAITIAPGAATVGLSNLAFVYDGTAKTPTVTTVPSGVAVTLTYNSDPTITAPVNAGNYSVSAAIADPNYTGPLASATLTIAKATAAISVTPYTLTYDGAAHTAVGSATGVMGESLSGLDLSGTTHTNAGTYGDTWTFTDATGNYTSAIGSITDLIGKAHATIALAPLAQLYDGTAKPVTATTTPAHLAVTLTYDGAAAAPIYPGLHAVTATINDANYSGTLNATLDIYATALVRHAPIISSLLAGSVQVLSAETIAFNNATVSGDLLVPGSPNVSVAAKATYAGTIDATGSATPANYGVSVGNNTALRHVVRRVDAVAMLVIPAPAAPTGTRDVAISDAGAPLGDPATLRNLSVSGNAGTVAVPAGTYGAFAISGNATIVLGTAGATEPAVYDLQGLTVSGNATLKVAGPVIIFVANGPTFSATSIGSAAHPDWLAVRVTTDNTVSADATVSGSTAYYGSLELPTGTLNVSGHAAIEGSVAADKLMLSGNAVIENPTP